MKTTLCAAAILVGCALELSACSSSNSAGQKGGSGGQSSSGSGGQTGGGSGGNQSQGSGGQQQQGSGGTNASSGGATNPGSGGANNPGSGGANNPGSGGANNPGSGGASTGSGGRTGGGTGGTVAGTGGSAGSTGGVVVALGSALQTMDGFGINNVFQPDFTTDFLDTLFDVNKGIGLSIMRIGMSSTGDLYNGANDIKGASSRGVKTFIASVWTAPANCKDNNSLQAGGHMKSDACYMSWSKTIAAFPAKVKAAANVDLYAMAPANEPDFASCGSVEPCNGNYDTMLYTDVEAVKLVNMVGPMLHALTPPVKLISPEASEWVHLWTNNSASGSVPSNKPSSNPLKGMGYDYGHALFKDATAWGLLDLIGVHQYDSQVAQPWPSDVTSKKPIWETEMSGVKWWPEQGPSSDIANGVVVAGWIHDAIVNGPASAWLWWWPKPLSGGTDDNEGLYLMSGVKAKRLYTLGNYSKFIRPGYTRVDITGNSSADLLMTAYKASDGTVVIVAINKGTASATVPITISGGTAPASLVPWVTSATDDLASKTAVTVSGGSFTATLASKTVTTFVGK